MATPRQCVQSPLESLPGRSIPVPRLSYQSVQAQVQELQTIDRRLAELGHALRHDIDACEAGTVSVDDLVTAMVLVRLWRDVLILQRQTQALVRSSLQRLDLARTAVERLSALKGVDHG